MKQSASVKELPAEPLMSERSWVVVVVVVLAATISLRVYDLNLVPLHHDEGVNGNFLVRLVREGFYRYDPDNYHGPTLYYFAAVIPRIVGLLFGTEAQNHYGLTTFTIRLIPVLFGIATVWLILTLRPQLGNIGSLAAAAMVAISPGAVYLSRYFIHESMFVFFTLGIVVALVNYYRDGHPLYLMLAAVAAALLFATKETWIISMAVLILALLAAHLDRWLIKTIIGRKRYRRLIQSDRDLTLSEWMSESVERLGGWWKLGLWLSLAVVVFV